MVPQTLLRVHVAPQWSATSTGSFGGAGVSRWNETRETWMAAFCERFAELRPTEDEEAIQARAAEVWADAGGHDPVISAEMEHEATYGD